MLILVPALDKAAEHPAAVVRGKAAYQAPKHIQGIFCVLPLYATFGENGFDEIA